MVRHAHHEGLSAPWAYVSVRPEHVEGRAILRKSRIFEMMADFRKNLSVPRFSS